MPATYSKFGITFLYPDNWVISEEAFDESPQAVTVQSPSGGFWSLHLYPTRIEPALLLAEALQVMQQEYEGLEYEATGEPLGDFDMVGYDMDFYCLDLVVSARVRCFAAHGRTYLLLYQAETREFDQLEPVFRAMTWNMLQGQTL